MGVSSRSVSGLGADTHPHRHKLLPFADTTTTASELRLRSDIDLGTARELAVATSGECRALYWALRSNYHVTLEMAQLADVLPGGSEARLNIRQLSSQLHSRTYDMQARLCDAARVEYAVTQLEALQAVCEIGSSAAQVLMDDLEDQVRLVRDAKWKQLLEAHFAALEVALLG